MNYGRFFAILKRIPGNPDRDEIISQYTNGRTTSLKAMSYQEYVHMCDDLDSKFKDSRTKARSAALKLMQQLGIDTTDWTRINAFCQDSRIAGQEFRSLSYEELQALQVKLRSIQRRGGLKPIRPRTEKHATQIVFLSDNGIIN